MKKANKYIEAINDFFAAKFGVSISYSFSAGGLPPIIEQQIVKQQTEREIIPLFSSAEDSGPYLSVYNEDGYLFTLHRSKDGTYMAYLVGSDVEMEAGIGLKFALLLGLAERNIFGFHALTMLAEKEGARRVIMLSAPSGTGKTTHGELWQKLNYACIIDGDYAF